MKPLHFGPISIQRVVEIESLTSPKFLFDAFDPEILTPHLDWLTPWFFQQDSQLFMMSIHAFLISTPQGNILVDTCVGNDKPRSHKGWNQLQTAFLERLAQAGARPEDIDYVFCTHLHFDHVGWNTKKVNGRWVPTFPRATYLFYKKELDYWQQEVHQMKGDYQQVMEDSVRPILASGQAKCVEVDHQICQGVSLMPTFGHTPGHCSVLIHPIEGQKNEGISAAATPETAVAVITGDMLHHPFQIAYPDWSSSYCYDRLQSAKTRRTFVERYAGSDTLILGTHFAAPTYGKIRREATRFLLDIDV